MLCGNDKVWGKYNIIIDHNKYHDRSTQPANANNFLCKCSYQLRQKLSTPWCARRQLFLISTQVNTNSTQNPTPIQLNTTSATILAPNHYSRNKQINKQKQLNWNIELDSSESVTCDTFFMDTVQAGCQCCGGQFSNCYFASSLLHTVHSLAWLLICKNVPRTPRARLAGGCTASVCTSAM